MAIIKYQTITGGCTVYKFTYLTIQALADGLKVTSTSSSGDIILNTGEALSTPVNPAVYDNTIITGDCLLMTDGLVV